MWSSVKPYSRAFQPLGVLVLVYRLVVVAKGLKGPRLGTVGWPRVGASPLGGSRRRAVCAGHARLSAVYFLRSLPIHTVVGVHEMGNHPPREYESTKRIQRIPERNTIEYGLSIQHPRVEYEPGTKRVNQFHEMGNRTLTTGRTPPGPLFFLPPIFFGGRSWIMRSLWGILGAS